METLFGSIHAIAQIQRIGFWTLTADCAARLMRTTALREDGMETYTRNYLSIVQ